MAGRAVAGLATGCLAGAIGMSLGHALLGTSYGGRALGLDAHGQRHRAREGLYERSPIMLRQGMIAAAVGGLAGGLPFGLVYSLLSPLSEVGSRAVAFVFFGSCVGAAIVVAEAAFARAWLTVVEGHMPGGQIPLSSRTVMIGRSSRATLRFSEPGDTEIEREHARIVRQPGGRFALEDIHSRHGTSVNRRRILTRVLLNDGDMIGIGADSIRFDVQKRRPAPVKNPMGRSPPPLPSRRSSPLPPRRPSPVLSCLQSLLLSCHQSLFPSHRNRPSPRSQAPRRVSLRSCRTVPRTGPPGPHPIGWSATSPSDLDLTSLRAVGGQGASSHQCDRVTDAPNESPWREMKGRPAPRRSRSSRTGATRPGFEPGKTGPKPVVIPFHHRVIGHAILSFAAGRGKASRRTRSRPRPGSSGPCRPGSRAGRSGRRRRG